MKYPFVIIKKVDGEWWYHGADKDLDSASKVLFYLEQTSGSAVQSFVILGRTAFLNLNFRTCKIGNKDYADCIDSLTGFREAQSALPTPVPSSCFKGLLRL